MEKRKESIQDSNAERAENSRKKRKKASTAICASNEWIEPRPNSSCDLEFLKIEDNSSQNAPNRSFAHQLFERNTRERMKYLQRLAEEDQNLPGAENKNLFANQFFPNGHLNEQNHSSSLQNYSTHTNHDL
eukprot:Sdes_comp20932_c1_seq1m18366